MNNVKEQLIKRHGWTSDYVNDVMSEYERFLQLRYIYDDKVSPSNDVDKFWHQHILNVNQYYTYCIIAIPFLICTLAIIVLFESDLK